MVGMLAYIYATWDVALLVQRFNPPPTPTFHTLCVIKMAVTEPKMPQELMALCTSIRVPQQLVDWLTEKDFLEPLGIKLLGGRTLQLRRPLERSYPRLARAPLSGTSRRRRTSASCGLFAKGRGRCPA